MVGDVVEAPFPYTDLTGSKIRPAVALAEVGMGDWLLCEITSRRHGRPGDIRVTPRDMDAGSLDRNSWARAGRIHAINSSLFRRTAGRLTDAKREEILQEVRNLF